MPLIIGSTRDEGRSFSQSSIGWTRAQYEDFVRSSFGANADAILKQYPWPAETKDRAAVAYQVAAIRTDSGALGADAFEQGIGGCGTAALTAIFARNVPVYAYEFSVRTGPGWYPVEGYQWASATPQN